MQHQSIKIVTTASTVYLLISLRELVLQHFLFSLEGMAYILRYIISYNQGI